jgi:hypothetical protein
VRQERLQGLRVRLEQVEESDHAHRLHGSLQAKMFSVETSFL